MAKKNKQPDYIKDVAGEMLKALERYRSYGGEWFADLYGKFLDHCIYFFSWGLLGKQQDEPIYAELFDLMSRSQGFEDVLGELYMGINSEFKASSLG